MKKIKVKKLYNGCVSLRDYNVKDCIEKNKGIMVSYQNWTMTIPVEKLAEFFQFHSGKFESKFNSKKYELLDMRFVPDNLS